MAQKYQIDTAWFSSQLKKKNKTAEGLGRFLNLHKSAVSRMLSGQRQMTAEEQDNVARYLGVSIEEVAAHRAGFVTGFEEKKQEAYVAEAEPAAHASNMRMFTEADIIYKDGKRWMEGPDGLIPLHPIFGCMKGTMTIPDDLDLTEPVDPDWGNVYEDD